MQNETDITNPTDKAIQLSSSGGSRGKRFLKDFGIYAIGNIGMKLITFLLVPLYTYFIDDPGEYGYFDVCLATCYLLLPLVTMQLRDGSFRFLVNNKDEQFRKQIISSVYNTLCLTFLLTIMIAFGVSLFYPIRCLWYTIAMLLVMCAYEVTIQIIRATNDNVTFVTTNLIASATTVVYAILFVAVFNMGIDGIFLSNILSKVTGLIIGEVRVSLFSRYFDFRLIDTDTLKKLWKYSLPLIPTSMLWWLTGFANRQYIMHFVGPEANGYYAVSARIMTMLFVLGTIFQQTWQEHAFKQYGTPEQDKTFSDIFNNFMYVFMTIGVVFIFAIKAIFPILIGPKYQFAVNLVYLMVLTNLGGSIGHFFGVAYECAKDTKRLIPAAVVNAGAIMTLSFFFVQQWGIYGVLFSTLTTSIFYYFYRYYDTRRYFTLKALPNLLVPLALLLISAVPFYYSPSIWIDMLWMAVALIISFIAMPGNTKRFAVNAIASKLKRKK